MYKYKVITKDLDFDKDTEPFLNSMSEKGWEFVSHSYISDEAEMNYIFRMKIKDNQLGPPR